MPPRRPGGSNTPQARGPSGRTAEFPSSSLKLIPTVPPRFPSAAAATAENATPSTVDGGSLVRKSEDVAAVPTNPSVAGTDADDGVVPKHENAVDLSAEYMEDEVYRDMISCFKRLEMAIGHVDCDSSTTAVTPRAARLMEVCQFHRRAMARPHRGCHGASDDVPAGLRMAAVRLEAFRVLVCDDSFSAMHHFATPSVVVQHLLDVYAEAHKFAEHYHLAPRQTSSTSTLADAWLPIVARACGCDVTGAAAAWGPATGYDAAVVGAVWWLCSSLVESCHRHKILTSRQAEHATGLAASNFGFIAVGRQRTECGRPQARFPGGNRFTTRVDFPDAVTAWVFTCSMLDGSVALFDDDLAHDAIEKQLKQRCGALLAQIGSVQQLLDQAAPVSGVCA
jgi:hypothetical protein